MARQERESARHSERGRGDGNRRSQEPFTSSNRGIGLVRQVTNLFGGQEPQEPERNPHSTRPRYLGPYSTAPSGHSNRSPPSVNASGSRQPSAARDSGNRVNNNPLSCSRGWGNRAENEPQGVSRRTSDGQSSYRSARGPGNRVNNDPHGYSSRASTASNRDNTPFSHSSHQVNTRDSSSRNNNRSSRSQSSSSSYNPRGDNQSSASTQRSRTQPPNPNPEGWNNWADNPRNGNQNFPTRPKAKYTPQDLHPGEQLNDWGQPIAELIANSTGGKDNCSRDVRMRMSSQPGGNTASKSSNPCRDGQSLVKPCRPIVLLADPGRDNRRFRRPLKKCAQIMRDSGKWPGQGRSGGIGMGSRLEMAERARLSSEIIRPMDHFRYGDDWGRGSNEGSGGGSSRSRSQGNRSGSRRTDGNRVDPRGGTTERIPHGRDGCYADGGSSRDSGRRLPKSLERFEWIRRAWDQYGFAGYCQDGREWVRMVGGYKCDGGRHMVTDELLANRPDTAIGCGMYNTAGMYILLLGNQGLQWENGPFYDAEIWDWTGRPGDRGPTINSGIGGASGRSVHWKDVPALGPFESYEEPIDTRLRRVNNRLQQDYTQRDYWG